MSNKSGTSSQVISLPKSGGALHGIGEKFSSDLFTGTGNFTIPIAFPSGRNGFQPEISLVYSTGNGNGSFGLGWGLSIPGVSRKTSKGIPRYRDYSANPNEWDTFVLSGVEDLVPIEHSEHLTRYRPRTEGLFARIEHRHDGRNDYWKVKSKDGLISFYGTPNMKGKDLTVIANPKPDDPSRPEIFSWKLSRTVDPFGNRIVYEYGPDSDNNHGVQLYLKRIRYVDYTERSGQKEFLISVTFDYETLPESYPEEIPDERRIYPFSEYRAGFEIRTRKRCTRIAVATHAGQDELVRTYDLIYLDQRADLSESMPRNGVSVLSQIKVTGYDGGTPEFLPLLEFGYTSFDPLTRKKEYPFSTHSDSIPECSLDDPHYELVDLFGNGLPDVIHMNGKVRYWRNLGEGVFAKPQPMKPAPIGIVDLKDSSVQLADFNGDGRADLLRSASRGYYSLTFQGSWNEEGFVRYQNPPPIDLEDPQVRLVDLNGDGIVDALFTGGSYFIAYFNDPQQGWVDKARLSEKLPKVSFADPQGRKNLLVKLADMTGDGLNDLVQIRNGKVYYWPNLGYGKWGQQITMSNCPRFEDSRFYERLLIGDVDGDGLADLVYLGSKQITVWINQSGNSWSEAIQIPINPNLFFTGIDAIRLVDMLGTGTAGILWSYDSYHSSVGSTYSFLDLTGGVKPYLLNRIDNHMGAETRIAYVSSTQFYLEDEKQSKTRWKTPLPFPVQVVERVEVIDHLSKGKLTTQYRYHHGYWDGTEREFRGFGMVEQLDTETIDVYNSIGLHGGDADFKFTKFIDTDKEKFSPPTLTKTWFHLGPVQKLGDEFKDWEALDYSDEYWPGDKPISEPWEELEALPQGMSPLVKRDALRTLRGRILWTELYALDRLDNQDRVEPEEDRPYTVTESLFGVTTLPIGEDLPDDSKKWQDWQRQVFFPHSLVQRTTQWERGDEPMTQFTFTDAYDTYGQPLQQTQIACPRGWHKLEDKPTGDNPYLATRTEMVYAEPPNAAVYIHDRVAKTTTYEFKKTGNQTLVEISTNPTLKIIGQTLNFYDGQAFTGLPTCQTGQYGALVRTETLILTKEILNKAYEDRPMGKALPYLKPDSQRRNWPPDRYPKDFRDKKDYADETRPGLAITPLGYGFAEGGAGSPYHLGYFVATERRCYDFQQNQNGRGRGLVVAMRDPLGQDTKITYDTPYQLLAEEVTDPAHLKTTAKYDYRVLQPRLIVDLNGNETEFRFSPLGLLKETWVKGKPGKAEGDRQRPSIKLEYDFLAFENSPPQNRQPIYVHTIRQVYHDTATDIDLPQRNETIESWEYSDGFGRLLQTRTQAEEVRFGDEVFGGGEQILPASQKGGKGEDPIGRKSDDPQKPNVIVSVWQTYDNKGRVVEKYEPFYAQGWDYAAAQERERGQKNRMFYDPRGQVILTVNPDGSEQRVIYGIPNLENPNRFTPTPWEVYTYDANDNAGRTHDQESLSYRHHWNTPTSAVMDALGRTVLTVERNRAAPPDDTSPLPPIEVYQTVSTYDIRGNLTAVRDPLGREVFCAVYDLTPKGNEEEEEESGSQVLRLKQLDAGIWWMVFDAAGNEIERQDSKKALILQTYDVLNRPSNLWARDYQTDTVTLREQLEYGDRGNWHQLKPEEKQKNKDANLLGKLHHHYDEAGHLTFSAYDFKGNVLEKERRVISLTAMQQSPNFRVNWPPDNQSLEQYAEQVLEAQVHKISRTYDALNRVQVMQYPQDVKGVRKELRPQYNRAGALESVRLDSETYVERIAYNAKGQRTLIAYGNGLITRYAYDSQTFRLSRLRTERYQQLDPPPDLPTYQLRGAALQDFSYTYDLTGNILTIQDCTPGSGVKGTRLGENALNREFTYDPLYRLLSATGRECKTIPSPRPWGDISASWQGDKQCGAGFYQGSQPTPNEHNAPHLTALYREEYAYDPAGNMLELTHQRSVQRNGGISWETIWTRNFGMGDLTPEQWHQEWPKHLTGEWPEPPGNRLTHVIDRWTGVANPSVTVRKTHTYDANGNLTQENDSRFFEWDHSDRLRRFHIQAGSGPASVEAYYLYDADGQRVQKVVRKGNRTEVTVYIDGLFEYHCRVEGENTKENNTLHVMDDQQRIALMRVGEPLDSHDTSPSVQFQLGDHLGSSNLVVDADAEEINREEFTPYGETSFGGFAKKRYRFTGKERDEESGLNYHGARYYAPWFGRWLSPDPQDMGTVNNLFAYAQNNPIKLVDPTGTQSDNPPRYSSLIAPANARTNPTGTKSNSSSQHRVRVDRERGIKAAKRLEKLFRSKGHGVKLEVTLAGGKSRLDITPDPEAGQTIGRTIESKLVNLRSPSYQTKSGSLDVSKIGALIRKDLKQVQKHERDLRKGIKPDLPFRESIIYQIEGATPKEVAEFRQIFRAEATPLGIKGGVMPALKSSLQGFSKAVTKSLPVVGALSILFTPSEAPAAERVFRAVAGEIGIGPFDLEMVFDAAVKTYMDIYGSGTIKLMDLPDPVRFQMEVPSWFDLRPKCQSTPYFR